MVRLRLTRGGRHKRPFYRIVAADSRMPRDGRYIEVLGTYDPLKTPAAVTIKQDRVMVWLKQGAQPSVTVHHLLDSAGVLKQLKEASSKA